MGPIELEPYMELSGVELANSLRTLSYLRMGLGGAQWAVQLASGGGPTTGIGYGDTYGDYYLADAYETAALRCYCGTFDIGNFKDPAYDLAPWYDADRPESNEFLGLIPRITLLPVAARQVSRRAMGRGDIGPLIVGPRVIDVRGAIFAGSRAGMGYGERWLSRALAGGAGGCAGDTLTVLPYCTATDDDDGSDALRELVPVGIVDGPLFSAPVIRATCQYQEVSFQLAAGEGWLRKTTGLFSGALGAGSTCETVIAPVAADAAAVITITAGATVLTGVEITAGDIAYTLIDLPALASMVIDASKHTVTVTDAAGVVIGSLNHLNFTGVFAWIEVTADDAVTVCVDATTATGTTGATLTIEQVDLEL